MNIRQILDILTEASYDQMVKNMYSSLPEKQAEIKQNLQWAKQVLKKDERVVWFLRILQAFLNSDPKLAALLGTYQLSNFENFKNELGHFFGIEYDRIQNYQFQRKLVSDVLNELTALEDEFNSKQEAEKPVSVQQGDYELFKFNNGYAWWFVDRAYCPEEGRSGSHCGNVNGQYAYNQRILSFRKDGHVLMTFILEPSGELGEMKAKHNQKPPAEFHPQIVKLLTWDKIKGIGSTANQYRPSSNFNIFDLDSKYITYLYRLKPELVMSQVQVTPVALLGADQNIQNLLWDQAVKIAPEIELAKENTSESWHRAIKIKPQMILYAPPTIDDYAWNLSKFAAFSDTTGVYLFNAPKHVAEDKEIMSEVIGYNPSLIEQVLATNPIFEYLAKHALDTDVEAIDHIQQKDITKSLSDYFFKKYPDEVFRGVHRIPLKFVPNDILEKAVKSRPFSMLSLLKETDELRYAHCLAAVQSKNASEVYDYIPDKFRTEEVFKTAIAHDARTVWAADTKKFVSPLEALKLVATNPAFRLSWLDHGIFKNLERNKQFYATALKLGLDVDVPDNMIDQEIAYQMASNVASKIPKQYIDQKVVDIALSRGSHYMLSHAPKEYLTPENTSKYFLDMFKTLNMEITPKYVDEFVSSLPATIQDKTRKLLTKDEHELAESINRIKELAGLLGK